MTLWSLPLFVILEGAAHASLGPIITPPASPPTPQLLVQMVLWGGRISLPFLPHSRAAADCSAVPTPTALAGRGVLGRHSLDSLPFRSPPEILLPFAPPPLGSTSASRPLSRAPEPFMPIGFSLGDFRSVYPERRLPILLGDPPGGFPFASPLFLPAFQKTTTRGRSSMGPALPLLLCARVSRVDTLGSLPPEFRSDASFSLAPAVSTC